jgi:hypothetical protein
LSDCSLHELVHWNVRLHEHSLVHLIELQHMVERADIYDLVT